MRIVAFIIIIYILCVAAVPPYSTKCCYTHRASLICTCLLVLLGLHRAHNLPLGEKLALNYFQNFIQETAYYVS